MESLQSYSGINIGEVCRVCLKMQNNMKCIRETELESLLFECASIQLTHEENLHYVCIYCIEELHKWCSFKNQVLRSFEIGRWLLQKSPLPVVEQNEDTLNVPNKIEEVIVKLELIKDENDFYYNENFDEKLAINDEISDNEEHDSSSDDKPCKCKYCKLTFITKIQLKCHIEEVHTNVFKCEVCSKYLVNKYTLKSHMKIHTNDKPFGCAHCEKHFTGKKELRLHIKSHTQEKDYICETCGRAFAAPQTLKYHVKIHTGEKREAKYKCDICNRMFLTSSQRKVHVKSQHTDERDYPCLYCEKSFVTRVHANNHMRVHTGVKDYSCDICGKTFVSKATLENHLKVHADIRPFPCDACEKSFVHVGALNAHKKYTCKKMKNVE